MTEQETIRELQHDLRLLSITDDQYIIPPVDGVYGQETAAAVRAFQRANGLPVTGRLDEETGEALTAAYADLLCLLTDPRPLAVFPAGNGLLSPGNSGDTVAILQTVLNAIGRSYHNTPTVALSGQYDKDTVAAVRWWRRCCDLPPADTVDRICWDRLADLYHSR